MKKSFITWVGASPVAFFASEGVVETDIVQRTVNFYNILLQFYGIYLLIKLKHFC